MGAAQWFGLAAPQSADRELSLPTEGRIMSFGYVGPLWGVILDKRPRAHDPPNWLKSIASTLRFLFKPQSMLMFYDSVTC